MRSMEDAQMLLHLQRTQTTILMLILIVLKRLWTGRFCSSFLCCACVLSAPTKCNPTMSFFWLLFRFAQFFIKPLMSSDATTREIKAVDSGLFFFSGFNAVSCLFFIYCWSSRSLILMQRIRKTCCLMLGEWTRYWLLPLLSIFITARCWIYQS